MTEQVYQVTVKSPDGSEETFALMAEDAVDARSTAEERADEDDTITDLIKL